MNCIEELLAGRAEDGQEGGLNGGDGDKPTKGQQPEPDAAPVPFGPHENRQPDEKQAKLAQKKGKVSPRLTRDPGAFPPVPARRRVR